ncbi:MAG: glycosyltransferase family 10 [Cyanobacteriota bacterium]|nr:glycosyltransferase family 10 [Cyanobacteriota bacterium]
MKVSTSHPELSQLLLRQTPGHSGLWGDCQFYVNEPVDQCDWWFICHESALKDRQEARCDPAHLVYVSMEPNECAYQKFYNQFSKLVICSQGFRHPSIIYRNGITWWAGISVGFENGHHFSPEANYDYDSLNDLAPPLQKLDRISIITSNKDFLPGHRQRLAFIERLKKSEIADRIDVYGGGHNPIADKMDAILPYKYHIALENTVLDHYWTEKIGDAFLGYAVPFYHGCKNISSYFPHDSLLELDIDSSQAIPQIKAALDQDLHSQRLHAINAARKRVLNDYNLFALMASIASTKATRLRPCQLHPPKAEAERTLVKKALSKMKQTARKWLR